MVFVPSLYYYYYYYFFNLHVSALLVMLATVLLQDAKASPTATWNFVFIKSSTLPPTTRACPIIYKIILVQSLSTSCFVSNNSSWRYVIHINVFLVCSMLTNRTRLKVTGTYTCYCNISVLTAISCSKKRLKFFTKNY